jgi:hypothetical protein
MVTQQTFVNGITALLWMMVLMTHIIAIIAQASLARHTAAWATLSKCGAALLPFGAWAVLAVWAGWL